MSAAVFGAQRANESMVRRLAVVRNHLATSSSQISGALSAHLTRGESIETTLARVDQGVGSISSLLRDIGDLIGSDGLTIETEAIIQSKKDVVGLGEALDTLKNQVAVSPEQPSGPGARLDEILPAIENMQSLVSETLASLSRAEVSAQQRQLLEEQARCPYCSEVNRFQLGSLIGDSANPVCDQCGERFYAHRGQMGVFANPMSGKTVGSVLTRAKMRLPGRQTRRSYLEIIERAHTDGKIKLAHDVANAVDFALGQTLPANVRMPLFFALVNRDYGLVTLEEDSAKQLRDREVVAFDASGDVGFIDNAEAAWLAQALFRLTGQGLSETEVMTYFFGHDQLTSDESAIFSRARKYADTAIEARASSLEDNDDVSQHVDVAIDQAITDDAHALGSPEFN